MGPTVTRPVQERLAVLLLDNWLYIQVVKKYYSNSQTFKEASAQWLDYNTQQQKKYTKAGAIFIWLRYLIFFSFSDFLKIKRSDIDCMQSKTKNFFYQKNENLCAEL